MRMFGQHVHHHPNPWEQAPPWAIELAMVGLANLQILEKVYEKLDTSKLTPDAQKKVNAIYEVVHTTVLKLDKALAPAKPTPSGTRLTK